MRNRNRRKKPSENNASVWWRRFIIQGVTETTKTSKNKLRQVKKEKVKGTPVMRRAPQTSLAYLFVFMFAVILVTGAFVFHLHVRFQGVWLGYETSKARKTRTELLVERRELRLELASLKSPARVQKEARKKLGMEMPDHERIIPIGKKVTPVLASGRAR